MKRVLLIIISVFLLVGCSNDKEKLVLSTEAGFAPYEYYSNGQIVGVDIDIVRKIAEYFVYLVYLSYDSSWLFKCDNFFIFNLI